MRCDDVAEFVSALCDGEAIPRAAAEHVKGCADCQESLREYMEMGAELRLMASVAMDERVAPRVWNGPRSRFDNLWQKGWETMRVPRLAFAVLIAATVGLGSTFAMVEVRAHSNGSVVLLKIAGPERDFPPCALSTEDKKQESCGGIGWMNGQIVGYQIDLTGRKDGGVELAVRTKNYGSASGTFLLADIRKEPQKVVFFEPGKTAKLDVVGAGALTVTGEWLDHMPVFLGGSTQDVQVDAEGLRLVSPLLISDKQVLGDFAGGSASADKAGEGVEVYMPGEGRFLLSLSPMRGAVQGDVVGNRISFEEGGRAYVFVTGSPVSRGEHVWVLHEAGYKPAPGIHVNAEHEFVSAGELRELAPQVVMEGK